MALNYAFSRNSFALLRASVGKTRSKDTIETVVPFLCQLNPTFLEWSLIVQIQPNYVELVTLPATTQWRVAAALADGQPGWPSSYATSAAASTVRDLWWLPNKLKFQFMYRVNWLTIATGRATCSERNSGGGLRVGALWVRYEFHWVRKRLILHETQLAPGAWKRPFKVRKRLKVEKT